MSETDCWRGNITLIGMAGAGKSTTGVVVAKILQKDFVDGDLVIQKKTGRSLQAIIDAEGNDAFRRIEEEILLDLDVRDSVIAPGGSAIYYPRVMERFRAQGTVVYLEVSLAEITRRLSNLATRGVSLRPGQTIADLYAEREPLYRRYAHVTVPTEGLSLEESVSAILSAVGGWEAQHAAGDKEE